MKKLMTAAGVLLLLNAAFTWTMAQEKKEQLFLVGKEVVKPEMLDQYFELNRKMVDLCKEHGFPFSYNLWTTGDFEYYLWYAVEDLNAMDEVEKAWDVIVEKMEEGEFARFEECIEYQESNFVVLRNDLTYKPENPRLSEDEELFSRWQEFYIKKGTEKDVEALILKANTIFREKGLSDAAYFGEAKTGFEQPVYFGWTFAKSINDYWEQDQKTRELLGEALQEINREFVPYLRKLVEKEVWLIRNLSYEKIE
jgi:hypothetical protein